MEVIPAVSQRTNKMTVLARTGIATLLSVLIGISAWSPVNADSAYPKSISSTVNRLARTTTAVRFGLPRHIAIPQIGVDAPITILWLTNDGSMDAPASYSDTGWLRTGAKPGNPGTAVITGHYGWVRGKPTVFARLNRLQPGDTVMVTDRKWLTAQFVVRKIHIYLANDSTNEVFQSSSNSTRLNIVTCQGIWNPKTKSYPERLVVFAEKK